MAQILINSTVTSPVRLEVRNDIFLQHCFTRETEFSSLSLVFCRSFSKLSVIRKKLRVSASDLCCYVTLGNMLGSGIYGFSDPGKYFLENEGCSVGAKNRIYGRALANFYS